MDTDLQCNFKASSASLTTFGFSFLKFPRWPMFKWHLWLSCDSHKVIRFDSSSSSSGSRWNGLMWWTWRSSLQPQAAHVGKLFKCFLRTVSQWDERIARGLPWTASVTALNSLLNLTILLLFWYILISGSWRKKIYVVKRRWQRL